jgi:hypothetical protein
MYIIDVVKGVHGALHSPGSHTALHVVEQSGHDWCKNELKHIYVEKALTIRQPFFA